MSTLRTTSLIVLASFVSQAALAASPGMGMNKVIDIQLDTQLDMIAYEANQLLATQSDEELRETLAQTELEDANLAKAVNDLLANAQFDVRGALQQLTTPEYRQAMHQSVPKTPEQRSRLARIGRAVWGTATGSALIVVGVIKGAAYTSLAVSGSQGAALTAFGLGFGAAALGFVLVVKSIQSAHQEKAAPAPAANTKK